MAYQPKNVLVTGGAGFIGSNFIRHLNVCHPDVRIVNLDVLTYAGSLDNLRGLSSPRRHTLVRGDICDRRVVERLLREHCIETIVHFAADSHVDRSISGPASFVRTNFVGTFELLDAARQYWTESYSLDASSCRFHHISTDEVYGQLDDDDPAFTESTPYAPNSPYSASKAGADFLVRAYGETYGLPTTMTNCSNNYGPYQHAEKLIPKVILCCAEQQPIPVYGAGTNVRDWLFVLDHCKAIDAVLRHGVVGETYNVGGRDERRNIDVVRTICSVMDTLRPGAAPHSRLIHSVPDRPGHDWRYAVDISKISSDLNWEPQETFETGIRKTIEWYLDERKRSAGIDGDLSPATLTAAEPGHTV